jgi:hypothetical protein
MNRPFSLFAGLVVALAFAIQARAESTIEVDPQTLQPVSKAPANFAVNTDRAPIVTAQSRGNEGVITPVRWGWYGRPYGGYYRPYRSYYYGGGGGYPYRTYGYSQPYYNYGYSSYPSYYSYGYYPRYTTGYRYGINPGVNFYFGW